MSEIHVLVASQAPSLERYRAALAAHDDLAVSAAPGEDAVRARLADPDGRADVLVLDNGLPDSFILLREVRHNYPRLLIVLVDEDADLLMPGRADGVSTDPFNDDELYRTIMDLLRERRTETLRADALPPIRQVAKRLREANGLRGKALAVTESVVEMGYDLAAFYQRADAPPLILLAASGAPSITSIVPEKQKEDTVVAWLAQHGGTRIVGPQDEINYVLVKRGRLGAGIGVAVADYGVLLACKDAPDSISEEQAMMLELVSGQLIAALAREP